jgi:hypothetical protein
MNPIGGRVVSYQVLDYRFRGGVFPHDRKERLQIECRGPQRVGRDRPATANTDP